MTDTDQKCRGPGQEISWDLDKVTPSLPEPHHESCNTRHAHQEMKPRNSAGCDGSLGPTDSPSIKSPMNLDKNRRV